MAAKTINCFRPSADVPDTLSAPYTLPYKCHSCVKNDPPPPGQWKFYSKSEKNPTHYFTQSSSNQLYSSVHIVYLFYIYFLFVLAFASRLPVIVKSTVTGIIYTQGLTLIYFSLLSRYC